MGSHTSIVFASRPLLGAIWLAILTFLSGCLVSKEPLITETAVFPFSAGTGFYAYTFDDSDWKPARNSDGSIAKKILEIRDGYYVEKRENSSTEGRIFKLSKIESSPYYIMEQKLEGKDGYIASMYLLFEERQDDFYIIYSFSKENFENYVDMMKKKHPSRWSVYSFGDPWSVTDDVFVEIRSLPFLEIILPDMVDSGFSSVGSGYRLLASNNTSTAETPPQTSAVQIDVPGFPTVGYSNPEFLDTIYQGRTEQINLSSVGFYLTAFVGMFVRSDIAECQNVVNTATATRIAAAGSQNIIGQIFGGLVEAHRDRGGSRDDLFAQGFGAGSGTFGGMALSQAGAEADAQLFYNRHGCDSLVAKRFFSQVTDLAWQN